MPNPAGAMRPILRRYVHIAFAALAACSGGEPQPIVAPALANLRLEQVVFTQVVQNETGSLPLVAGVAAAAKVVISRSAESVAEVPVVLRLFRNGATVYTDTAKTGGVLSRSYSLAAASAQFLIPAPLVAPGTTWQVEIDPARTVPDSTFTDNRLPIAAPDSLRTVAVPPLRIRLIPVILASHANLVGDLTPSNADNYVRVARQIFPARDVIVTIGAPLTTLANFGAPPEGGDIGFWDQILGSIEQARLASGTVNEHWYGIVPIPPGYTRLKWGGLGYLGFATDDANYPAYSGVGADSRGSNPAYAQLTLAHELGHNFGRYHAPGCSPAAPVDATFPSGGGGITSIGHDVWSWANGAASGAMTVGPETADIMSYCAPPKWISAYNYRAILDWRIATVTMARAATRDAFKVVPRSHVAVP